MPESGAQPIDAAPPLAAVRGFPAPGGPIDLEVRRGEVVLLAGPNGSGKTSLLRALAGLPSSLAPREAVLGGRPATLLPASRLAAVAGVALHDPRDTLVGLTVHGEFRLRGRAVPDGLQGLADRDVATLSSGQARRVSLAAADRAGTSLLLLDEPTEGLDEAGRRRLAQQVEEARARGAVVVADHDPLVARLATRRIELGRTSSAPLPKAPAEGAEAGLVLGSKAAVVRRGETEVRLPALRLPAGVHGLTGANGSGKSTLLLHLAGLLGPRADGVAIHDTAPLPGGNVRLLLPRAGDLFRGETVRQELHDCAEVGLVPRELLDRHPLSLSAGEAQRVALTKTLGQPAPLVLLDEPEAHLDAASRSTLWHHLLRRAAAGDCLLVATHDADLLAACSSLLRLEAE